jgi:hypothetical protein
MEGKDEFQPPASAYGNCCITTRPQCPLAGVPPWQASRGYRLLSLLEPAMNAKGLPPPQRTGCSSPTQSHWLKQAEQPVQLPAAERVHSVPIPLPPLGLRSTRTQHA